MKISRTVAYAVQATLQLAEHPSEAPVPCSQIASDGHLPERFLLQILRHLVTHGILHSTRGVEGGYALERKPEEISLLDIIEAIEGPLNSALPSDGMAQPYVERLQHAVEQVTSVAREQLAAIKLSALMSPVHAGAPAVHGVR